jgi:homoserine dehydrogenase
LWHAVNEPADVVIELVGGIDPVRDVVHAALLRGRTVISANKALIATRWDLFERYTRSPGPRLRYSAAVGGALPVLETIARVSRASGIARVRAVINGTCNFVLDQLAAGTPMAGAVALAQQHGFAEADPTADLSGADAAQKLSLIAHAAFGVAADPRDIRCHGIESFTPEAIAALASRKRQVRLVASCFREHGAIRALVEPEELVATDYLAGARREENRVELVTTTGETLRLAGKGAGRWPTALAVMGDVYDWLESRESRATSISLNR